MLHEKTINEINNYAKILEEEYGTKVELEDYLVNNRYAISLKSADLDINFSLLFSEPHNLYLSQSIKMKLPTVVDPSSFLLAIIPYSVSLGFKVLDFSLIEKQNEEENKEYEVSVEVGYGVAHQIINISTIETCIHKILELEPSVTTYIENLNAELLKSITTEQQQQQEA